MDAFVGTIMAWPVSYAPVNWLFCQGQAISVNQNQALFAVIGTTYGGDGVVNFKLPNLSGRTIVGAGQGLGLSAYTLGQFAGVEQTTLTVQQMPTHTHAAALSQLTVSSLTIQASNAQATAHAPSPTANTIAAPYDVGNATEIAGFNSSAPNTNLNTGSGSATVSGSVTVQVAGGSQPVSILQPYLALNWIICLYGIYPPRP
jgi:microcystin-dependent protein